MANPTLPPFKRIRIVDNVKECIREFQLPQQYPSMVSSMESVNIPSLKSVNGNKQQKQTSTPKSIVLVLHNKKHGLSKLQKSRIKSISGRDLGEIKLRPISRNDVSKDLVGAFSGQSIHKKNRLLHQENMKPLSSFVSSSSSLLLCQNVDSERLTDKILSNENKPQNQTHMVKINNLCSPLKKLMTKTDNSKKNWQRDKVNNAEIKTSNVLDSENLVESRLQNSNNSPNLDFTGNLLNCKILREAVNSVPDKELRAKALQALAACNNGSGRQLSKQLPNHIKTVYDSAIQTVEFGLIKKDCPIMTKKNTQDNQRIKQITQATQYSPPQVIDMSAQCTLLNDEQLFSSNRPTKISELDKLMETIIPNDEQTRKINNILNYCKDNQRSTQFCNKIFNQLQWDFDTFKRFDEFGLLNIHKAVIQSRLQDVERHIMILQARRESVDILTQAGMTSLELAISYNICPEIVQALLKAGAQPARANPANDCALITASKLCSPMLKRLVNYVSSNGPLNRQERLDQLDSTGFAALHYCAQKGNIDGVRMLLRAGANVNLQDGRSGRTALFHAVENEYSKVVQVLLTYGANPDVPNFAGQVIVSLMDVIKNSPFKSSLNRIMK